VECDDDDDDDSDWEAGDCEGKVPHVFREGVARVAASWRGGFVVVGWEVEGFQTSALTTLGLSGEERFDSMTYWGPKQRKHSWNAVTFLENLASACPLEVEPAAETRIRAFMAWRPVAGPEALVLERQELRGPTERRGLTEVESGDGKL
jgi:hypothetical protein